MTAAEAYDAYSVGRERPGTIIHRAGVGVGDKARGARDFYRCPEGEIPLRQHGQCPRLAVPRLNNP